MYSTVPILSLVEIIKLCTAMKMNMLRTRQIVTGREENSSNVLPDCEFALELRLKA